MEPIKNMSKEMKWVVSAGYEDVQDLRIRSNNRMRNVIKRRIEGLESDQTEEKKDEKSYLDKYSDAKLRKKLEKLKEEGKITDEEYEYIKIADDIAKKNEELEAKYKRYMAQIVKGEQVHEVFLSKIKGVGDVLAMALIKNFGDCSKYATKSKLWAHTGNDVRGGKAPKKKKGEDLTFNPKLRTLTWKISDCLMKSNKGIYREIFDSEKQKQLARIFKPGELKEKYGKPYTDEETRLRQFHANDRALRKMRKIFLANYWECGREMAGLEVRNPYAEKLGHTSFITWKKAVRRENTYTPKLASNKEE